MFKRLLLCLSLFVVPLAGAADTAPAARAAAQTGAAGPVIAQADTRAARSGRDSFITASTAPARLQDGPPTPGGNRVPARTYVDALLDTQFDAEDQDLALALAFFGLIGFIARRCAAR